MDMHANSYVKEINQKIQMQIEKEIHAVGKEKMIK